MLPNTVKQEPGRLQVSRATFLHAAAVSLPIVLGYLPIGAAYGILGAQAGLPLWVVVGMSLFVYAGSAQFIAVELIQLGASWSVLTLTTLFVNLRHLLLALALVPYFRKVGRGKLLFAGFGLTDESFAVNSAQFAGGSHSVDAALLVNLIGHIAWNAASFIGYFLSSFIPNPSQYGLDFALPAMFIALLFLQLKRKLHYVVLVVTGLLSLLLYQLGLEQWSVIIAAVVGAGVGAICSASRNSLKGRRR